MVDSRIRSASLGGLDFRPQSLKPRGPGQTQSRLGGAAVAAGAIATLLALGLNVIGAWQPLENLSYKLLFMSRERLPLPDPSWDERIAVITIDDASLQAVGQFPWPRDIYAQLLDHLAPVQPAVVGLNVLFPDPTPHDAALGQAIFHSGNVVLALSSDAAGQAMPIAPDISQAAEGWFLLGHVAQQIDGDGISRRTQPYIAGYPAFAMAAVEMYEANLAATVTPQTPTDVFSLDEAVPDPLWINWPSRISQGSEVDELLTYSAHEVLSGAADLQDLRNRIVLVGVSATGVDDRVRTPLNMDPPVAGVYLHAAVIDNLLNQRWIVRLPSRSVPLILTAMAALTVWGFAGRGTAARLLWTGGLSAGWLVIVLGAFVGHVWLPLASPLATLVLTAIGLQATDQWQKQQLMTLFEMYASPEIADLIWQHKRDLLQQGNIAPEKLTATVLFLDIRGFTAITEGLPDEDLMPWLNEFLAEMTDCIMAHGGMVDKYMGDAIMAVFGVPKPRQHPAEIRQDAIAAVQASLAMQNRLEALNLRLAALNQPTLSIGIGLHTGTVIAGSVGNQRRLNYSVFGDTVNIASRLEELTKSLNQETTSKILLSSTTFDWVSHQFEAKRYGQLQLRGRQSETEVFQILS